MQDSGRKLLTSGQAAAVLHRSTATIARWARKGELTVADRTGTGFGDGAYLFDPDVVARKSLELALGKPDLSVQPTLDEVVGGPGDE